MVGIDTFLNVCKLVQPNHQDQHTLQLNFQFVKKQKQKNKKQYQCTLPPRRLHKGYEQFKWTYGGGESTLTCLP